MDFNYALAAVSPKVEAAFLARFALNIWLNSMSKSKWKLLHTCGRYVSFELVFLWVTTSLTNHGTSFGCGQVNWSRTGTVRSFLSNSICPHFNFLSFYALLRINVPRLLPLPNRPPHWHHQSSTAKLFAYVTFTHLPIDGTRRRVWKKHQHCNWCGLFASFGQFTSWVGVHCTRLGKWANAPGRIW